ncbi:NADPH-dependent FMN reductase [Pseudofulvibacter geojedonensis]|uniref:NADPH-dependent FMN reductase n=1 Tax=Pseudofulvibacter geojedonensis TaxID=1123758 RepID=A0ABW3I3B4_9FLAO
MKKIIALGASNSKQSINKVLATYIANKVKDADVSTLDLNDYSLPLYGIDLENESGVPDDAKKLLENIQNADGIVLSLAEHNGAYSTAFKNAFDWMSRIDGKLWNNIPMLLLSTSPGARGGATVLEMANNRFPYMGGNVVDAIAFPSFFDNFKEGNVVNKELELQLQSGVKKLEEVMG